MSLREILFFAALLLAFVLGGKLVMNLFGVKTRAEAQALCEWETERTLINSWDSGRNQKADYLMSLCMKTYGYKKNAKGEYAYSFFIPE